MRPGEVGIIGINTIPINKMSSTNTKIEYNIGRYTPAGVRYPDTLRMYIELDEANWIYFQYADNVLNTISSDLDGYNAVLRAAIEKRKKNEGYRFEMTDEMVKDALPDALRQPLHLADEPARTAEIRLYARQGR